MKQRGFTLLELLIAVGLMAVLAVLCWRGLDTILVSRERLNQANDELQSLTVAFSQLDEDLRRSWPTRLLEPGAPNIRFDDDQGRLIQMHLLREGGAALDPVRIERVAYRVNNGQLERGYADYLRGAALTSVAYRWQPLLSEVKSMQFRAWIEGQGWVAAASSGASKPVTGVEVVIERAANQRFLRVFAVQD